MLTTLSGEQSTRRDFLSTCRVRLVRETINLGFVYQTRLTQEKTMSTVFDAQQQLANIDAIMRETERMAQTLHNWPESYWGRRTYCPDWTASDAIAHLITGADFYAQVVDAGRRGHPQLPWGLQDISAFRQKRIEVGQSFIEGGSRALIEGFERQAAKLHDVFLSLQASDLDQVAWHPRGLVPIGFWMGMRLNEVVVHGWDIRQPHEAQAGLSPQALPAMGSVLPEMQLQFFSQRIAEALDGLYLMQASDRAWAFEIRGKTVTYHAEAPTQSDTCLHTDMESLVLLTMGRADLDAKRQSGAFTLSGDIEKGNRLCDLLFRRF
jgi:uncharacterized protein (TIGR03083 family)